MPSARARRVISRAKRDSESANVSAITVATSLADLAMRARMASWTVIVSPFFRPSFEGAWPAARAETESFWPSFNSPRSSASKTM